MKVAVLGTGAAGLALAVMLARDGHEPVLWSPSGKGIGPLQSAPLRAIGILDEEHAVAVAGDIADAVANVDTVILALPAMGHRAVMDALAPHLRTGQTIIISSQASLGALYLQRLLAARRIHLPIVGWSTTLLRARKTANAEVRIATIRKKVDLAVLPVDLADAGLATCRALFGDRFNTRSDLLAVSLSNINPQSHMALALLNFTRMELAEKWNQSDCSTEAVQRLNDALDAERMQIAAAFGLKVRSLQEHSEQTHGAAKPQVVTYGPATTETRYTLEDVPFGLVPILAIARIAGVAVPFHDAGLRMFSALYGRDFATENDLLPDLELEELAAADFLKICREGFAAT
ncbi:NAD/NADP-dependent octopine/nopaline dehydrogenase family protein [Szabonella alba]|uniref:NAD/NADP octopine/nopaline dehydrogenase family protein n=1 Tax=Szabonella alba TaxID=2804194 RepID=A0A8K0Y1U0_9RHOB|nr:NAD/NADP-dependent octopine/nopaline dehydrogenase family protein [Szabonella alba]MBL4919261.1 NAD/NADP octopine/nopaline dehydrogenase family protein [Szabonella alba]